jgi:hypothetical protein
MDRPTSITVKLWDKQQIKAPAKKKAIDNSNMLRRPNMLENDTKVGCKTGHPSLSVCDEGIGMGRPNAPVEHRRNEVPVQKLSIAVPFNALAIAYNKFEFGVSQ